MRYVADTVVTDILTHSQNDYHAPRACPRINYYRACQLLCSLLVTTCKRGKDIRIGNDLTGLVGFIAVMVFTAPNV